MNRDIKFRAWNKKMHEYDWRKNIQENVMREVKSVEIPSERKNFDKMQLTVWGNSEDPIVEVYFEGTDEFEIMQYTGLHDKNGKEIYEGDIVRYPDASSCGDSGEWDCFTNTGEVKYCNETMSYYFTERVSIEMDEIDINTDAEVIGNIYENPELLNRPSTDAT